MISMSIVSIQSIVVIQYYLKSEQMERGTHDLPFTLKAGIHGHQRSNIYYCAPIRSDQKGRIEQAHTMLRMVLPKKTSFEYLTQWDLRTIVYHINSTPREILNGRTPYDVALERYGIDILKALQLRPISLDEVNLTPKLIRFNH